MSTDAFFETLRDYKKERILNISEPGDIEFDYDDPLHVVKKLKRGNEEVNNNLTESIFKSAINFRVKISSSDEYLDKIGDTLAKKLFGELVSSGKRSITIDVVDKDVEKRKTESGLNSYINSVKNKIYEVIRMHNMKNKSESIDGVALRIEVSIDASLFKKGKARDVQDRTLYKCEMTVPSVGSATINGVRHATMEKSFKTWDEDSKVTDVSKLLRSVLESFNNNTDNMIVENLDDKEQTVCDNVETKLNKQEVLDWISEHELAWEDFVNYFEDIYQSSSEVPMDEIIGWISEHDELAEDFEARFNAGIFTAADDYDDFSEEEIEEHLAIDAYDQINSPNILEINIAKNTKLKENTEGKWNIGSNKLVSTDSQEYANLVDLSKLLQERSPNHYEYRVEKTYEDFGAGMQWYTIICDEKNGWGTHQVLSPREWIYLANTGDIEGTYEDVVSDKYFQDTVEKGKTTTLFNYMDSLED